MFSVYFKNQSTRKGLRFGLLPPQSRNRHSVVHIPGDTGVWLRCSLYTCLLMMSHRESDEGPSASRGRVAVVVSCDATSCPPWEVPPRCFRLHARTLLPSPGFLQGIYLFPSLPEDSMMGLFLLQRRNYGNKTRRTLSDGVETADVMSPLEVWTVLMHHTVLESTASRARLPGFRFWPCDLGMLASARPSVPLSLQCLSAVARGQALCQGAACPIPATRELPAPPLPPGSYTHTHTYHKNAKLETTIYKQEMPPQNDMRQKVYRNTAEFILLAIYCEVWGLPLSVGNIPSEILLEKTNFSFSSDCQSEIVSRLRVGTPVYFPI